MDDIEYEFTDLDPDDVPRTRIALTRRYEDNTEDDYFMHVVDFEIDPDEYKNSCLGNKYVTEEGEAYTITHVSVDIIN